MKINDLKDSINEYLKNYFNGKGSYNELIYKSADYSLNIGGKRVRPILFLLTYEMYRGNCQEAMPMAAAIEMIHTYSLIHDDLPCMDNDDLRRGLPTNHKVYGENMAVLAGDALLNEAMIVLMDYSIKNGLSALKASKEIAVAAGAEGMIGGQVVDILSEGKVISKEELNYMHLKKTGELIKTSIVSAAILAEAPAEEIELLKKFGYNLGLAFQIKDDILDVVGNVDKLGKNTSCDENMNKSNFITMYGLEKCNKMCEDLTKECIEILNKVSVDTELIKELTEKLLIREY